MWLGRTLGEGAQFLLAGPDVGNAFFECGRVGLVRLALGDSFVRNGKSFVFAAGRDQNASLAREVLARGVARPVVDRDEGAVVEVLATQGVDPGPVPGARGVPGPAGRCLAADPPQMRRLGQASNYSFLRIDENPATDKPV